MYLSRLHLQNWRTYADAAFDFSEPRRGRPIVLVGAMNGHGKTSFLMSLYLGLFGRYGLRHCEGLKNINTDDVGSYRQAVAKFRRNAADPEEPTVVDITMTPLPERDSDEPEVRVIRRWFFTGRNEPKPGDAFEQVEVHINGKPVRLTGLDRDFIQVAQERIERTLFEAHVAPAFFFDGEQAQKLIETAGEAGIKRAVEVMFGTKVIADVAERVSGYVSRARQNIGGKKKVSERQQELEDKLKERDTLNKQIAKLQADHQRIERDKEAKEQERERLHEEFARMGGANADMAVLQEAYRHTQQEQTDAERALADVVRPLGLALAMKRLALPIQNRFRQEELREEWEGLKRATLDNKEKVLSAALPEPAENDPLLGNIAPAVRAKVRDRFLIALEQIYNPPKAGTAEDYWLGHVRGEARGKVLNQLGNVFTIGSARAKSAAKRLRDAREGVEESKASVERHTGLPEASRQISEQLQQLSTDTADASRKLGALENEIRSLKAKHANLQAEVGSIQEELARLGPEQQRLAVAERVGRALEQIEQALKPTTTLRLEDYVTKHFVSIADRRFRNARIHLETGNPPEIRFSDGRPSMLLESNSGFEKRAFGIAFTLALAEITRRRLPLVIDTPLGNADSQYRLRTLKALAGFDLDQVIILSHDEEVDAELAAKLKSQVNQTFLAEYIEADNLSVVHPNRYFSR